MENKVMNGEQFIKNLQYLKIFKVSWLKEEKDHVNWPEEGCGQEVHVVVYYQPRDAQQEVHIQFDSEPEIL